MASCCSRRTLAAQPRALAPWLAIWLLLAMVAAPAQAAQPDWRVGEAVLLSQPGAGWDAPATVPRDGLDVTDGQAITLPHARARSLAGAGHVLDAQPEVVWYRLLQQPAPLGHTTTAQALYLPRWQTIGNVAVYVDGALAHATGAKEGSRVWNSFNRPLWVPLPGPATAGGAAREVLVRMASQPGVGGALSSAWIGPVPELLPSYRLRSWLQVDLLSTVSAVYVALGLMALAVWCVRRHDLPYLLFFAASLAHGLRTVHFTLGDQPLLLPDAWFGWLTVNALGWSIVFIHSFIVRIYERPRPRLERGLALAQGGISVLTLPVPWLLQVEAILPLATAAALLMLVVAVISGSRVAWGARTLEGRLLAAWMLMFIPAGVHDLLLQSYMLDMDQPYLAPYTSIGALATFLAIGYRKYVGAIHAVEVANTELERRLSEREAELATSYQQLSALERQQTLDAERRRLMQEMHDGIGSSLLSALRMAQESQLTEADMARVLTECIEDLKLSIDSLEHADTDLLGLLAALRFRLGPRLKAAGLTLHWRVEDVPPLPWLDPQSALHILRILQEVLTNIVKHSGARTIEIATGLQSGFVMVWVRDDGQPHAGPAPDAPLERSPGKGLANVRNRALAIGARYSWQAANHQQGNTFGLSLPLKAPARLGADS
jgi:signal transduction histidine kinase